jgi:hypothetical protein
MCSVRFLAALLAMLGASVQAAYAQADWRTPHNADGATHSVAFGHDCEYPGSVTGAYTVSMPVGDGEWVYLTREQHAYKLANPAVSFAQLCLRAPGPAFEMVAQPGSGVPVDINALLANPRPMAEPTPSPLPTKPAPQPNSQSLNQQLDRVIAEDARSWLINRYTPGSARDASVVDFDPATGRAVVFGRYTYNGSSTGWIRVVFNQAKPQCVEYHDFAGTCRAIGNNPSHYIALGGLVIAAAGAASAGGGSGSTSNGSSYEQCVARCNSSGFAVDPGGDAAGRDRCIRGCR